MNEGQKGELSAFPDSFILIIGYIHTSFHLSYSQTEGIIRATGKRLPANPPVCDQICKIINKLNIDIRKSKTDNDDDLIISTDSTGIKIMNRGQWMNKKWNTQNKKRYLKIHLVVHIKNIYLIVIAYLILNNFEITKGLRHKTNFFSFSFVDCVYNGF